MESRIGQLENRVEQGFEMIRLLMLSFDVRIERIEATGYESLSVAKNARADVRVLTEEVRAWAKEVLTLKGQLEGTTH
jgi:hypothetical protein